MIPSHFEMWVINSITVDYHLFVVYTATGFYNNYRLEKDLTDIPILGKRDSISYIITCLSDKKTQNFSEVVWIFFG